MPKGRHFSNPDLRALDQELDELKTRVTDLEKLAADRPYGEPYTHQVSALAPPTLLTVPFEASPDEAADQATQEVADELQPHPYYVKAEGRGWYTVRSGADGEPVHQGKLRKPAAGKKVAELLEARRAANG